MQAIEIKNLSFKYGNLTVFDDFNLSVSEGMFTTILGKNGSGKTVLANILAGNLKYDGEILIFGKPLNKEIFKEIKVVLSDMDDYDDIVINLFISLLHDTYEKDIKDKILKLATDFYFEDCLNRNFNDLNISKKVLIILGMMVFIKPKILVFDNVLEQMDRDLKIDVLKKFKRNFKNEKITIINMTVLANDALLGDNIILIDSGKVILKGSKKKVLEREDIFEAYDMDLPFVINLSNRLKFYELIDKIYLDEKKLVDVLWK